jgi:hypothetical protein
MMNAGIKLGSAKPKGGGEMLGRPVQAKKMPFSGAERHVWKKQS